MLNKPEGFAKSYLKEMKLLGLLMVKGKKVITEDMIQSAYFENVTQPRGVPRMGETRLLLQMIRESYADGFIVRLDQFIEEFGIQQAVDLMEKGEWEKIYNKQGISSTTF